MECARVSRLELTRPCLLRVSVFRRAVALPPSDCCETVSLSSFGGHGFDVMFALQNLCPLQGVGPAEDVAFPRRAGEHAISENAVQRRILVGAARPMSAVV